MIKNLHEGYLEIAEPQAARGKGREILLAASDSHWPRLREEPREFTFDDTQSASLIPYILTFIFGAVIGVGISVASISLLKKEEILLPQVLQTTEKPENTEELRTELNLIKRILVGVVGSLAGLEKAQAASRETDFEPKAPEPTKLRVSTEQANLRKKPLRESASVARVAKDTLLLSYGLENDWYKVESPLGLEAWISRDVVKLED